MKTRYTMLLAALLLAATTAFAQERVPAPQQDDDVFEDTIAFESEEDEAPAPDMQGMGMHGMGGRHGMQGMRGHGGRRGMGMHRRMAELNLTEEQRTKMADIHDRAARRAVPIRSNLEIAQLDLRKLLRTDKPAKSSVDAQIDKIAKLRGDFQKSRMQAMLEARDVLTPEQRGKMHGGDMSH
jgi:Spy/CpxP family protein refolding chaperone